MTSTSRPLLERDCGLYVHIPFCLKKCFYCDFVSYPVRSFDTSRYCEAVAREIEMTLEGFGWPEEIAARLASDHWPRRVHPHTVFVGGGTPTVLPVTDLAAVVGAIRSAGCDQLDWPDDSIEFTIEANPGTLSDDAVQGLLDMGVNRVSLGLQTTSDRHLALLGRTHSYSEFMAAYRLVISAGFSNTSVDLIYGLPGQTREEWNEDLSRTVDLEPDHISCYALTLCEGTSLWEKVNSRELPGLSDDLAADMYCDTVVTLSEAGYRHYEISNYARPGMECKHNQNYWANGYYLGVGVAAHSHLPGVRCENVTDVTSYIETIERGRLPLAQVELLTPEREVSDAFILGLRTSDGIDTELLSATYGVDRVSALVNRLERLRGTGLLEFAEGRVRLTEQAMILSNLVMVELL